MLLELAVGDAFGAAFEYAPELFVTAYNDPSAGYQAHPSHQRPGGKYTDDTQMSLAIAEAMISGEAWTPSMLADRFYLAFKRDPRTGYAKHFYALLQSIQSGGEMLDRLYQHNKSDKSGGAMRAAPLGVLPRIGEVMTKSRIQAAITHNTSDGMNAAIASSLMSHYFIHGCGPKKDLGIFIQDYVPGPWSAEWVGPVGSPGWQSVRAAITAIVKSSSMTELLKTCVGYTGDVDTVAAIAAGAAAHCTEIKNDIPQILYDRLEVGTFGRDYLIDIDAQLMKLKEG